jgi:Flp pilus assembly protein TadD
LPAPRRCSRGRLAAPEFAAAEGNLGVLLRRRGDIPGALNAYRRALALTPRDPSILGNLAALYSGLGRDREARAALKLADLTLATPYTILARGDLEAADGRVDDAMRYYRRAARLDPKLPDPHVSMARLARAAGHLDEARRAAERAVKLDPENPEAGDPRETPRRRDPWLSTSAQSPSRARRWAGGRRARSNTGRAGSRLKDRRGVLPLTET